MRSCPELSSERTDSAEKRKAAIELLRRRARVDLLSFMRWCWWMPSSRPLRVGRHTRTLCDRLTKAVDDWMLGRSTYLMVNMPFRHGKSDIVSRALPAFFLGRCASFHPDVIMSGYGTSLVKGFSKKVQSIMRSDAYHALYPGVVPDDIRRAAEEWSVAGSQGVVVAQGLGGSITGKGGNLIIVDDYCKNREEAESKTMRDKVWDSFSDDLMTRTNAPAAIVVVCATRWHEDDLAGRIVESMAKDPDYPRFESLVFPARKSGPEGWDTLFPELYGRDWYDSQRAQLGSYSAAALLDCVPIGDEARVFRKEWLRYYDKAPSLDHMAIYFFADSANSKKDEADFTTIWVVGYGSDGNYYVLDGVHDRLSLSERTDALFDLHRFWRPRAVFWEQVGAMSDVSHIQYVQGVQDYRFTIWPLAQRVEKATRIRSLQPIFEAGRMWFPKHLFKQSADGRRYDMIEQFVADEYLPFPSVRHDDMLDPLADITHKDLIGVATFPRIGSDGQEACSANTEWRLC